MFDRPYLTMDRNAFQAATIEEDGMLLVPWLQAFERLVGGKVALQPLDRSDTGAGLALTFPPVFEPVELIGGIGHFRHNPAMVEHVRQMGFTWNADGRVMSVPAPGAFNVRLASLGIDGSGFALAYANGTAPRIPLGNWLLRYMGGLITVMVNAPSFYASLAETARDPRALGDARWGLMSLAHDLSVHALNYHLIPRAAVLDLGERIRVAIPGRYASWSQSNSIVPLTLTYFYDNDFNRYTYAVWCRCRHPEEFGSIFLAPRNYDQLLAALEVRLEETRAGYGDVPSGDFDDMRELADTSFDVR